MRSVVCSRGVGSQRFARIRFAGVVLVSLLWSVIGVPVDVGFAGSSGAVVGVPRASLSAVAAGYAHTCVIVTGGQVTCWGDDFSGQVGNGATTGDVVSPPFPVTLPAGSSAVAVTAGGGHTCVLLNAGQVTCWGWNGSGQLGNGTNVNVDAPPAPVVLPGGATATAIAAGDSHTCALLNSGQVTCWGSDSNGQLGNGAAGSVNAPPSPITLPGGTTATAIAAGGTHTCALLISGQVTCWGLGGNGQLGNVVGGLVASPTSHVALPAGTYATAVTAGVLSACALLNTGQVLCWGDDGSGQVGNGDPTGNVFSPTQVTLPGGVTAVAVVASSWNVCALLTGGQVSCWGDNSYGQIGRNSCCGIFTSPSPPLTLPTGTTATAVIVGGQHACALLNVQRLTCWGRDTDGQLGNGAATTGNVFVPPFPVTLPAPIAGGVSALDAGEEQTCAVLGSGQVTCWGGDFDGQLGNGPFGDTARPSTPITLPGGATAIAVSAGFVHTCALLNTAQVTCWGNAGSGALGNGAGTGIVSSPPAPVVLPGGATAVAVGAGNFTSCALLTTGQITCWGSDYHGVLGNGAATASVLAPPAPVVLPGGATATAVSVGDHHVCALLNTGQVTCWGDDTNGQLGNGPLTGDVAAPPDPVTLPAGTSATAVSAALNHTCVLLNTGEVTCWGADTLGQLGNGPTGAVDTPPPPITLPAGTTATAVSASWTHTCALLNTGQVTCWGDDSNGRLGNGAGGSVDAPPAPISLPAGATATKVATGDNFSCAVLNTGQVACWGSNHYANLGDGTATDAQTPVMAGVTAVVQPPPPGAATPVITVQPVDTDGQTKNIGDNVADPVNTASGNLSDVHNDLAGEAFGLDVVRAYNGFDPTSSALGARWRYSTGPTLEAASADVRLTLSDGSRFLFTANGASGWLTPDGLQATLATDPAAPTGGGTLPMLRVAYQNGNIDRYDTLGRLIQQLSWDGRSATTTYDGSGRLATVAASTGQTLTFTYDLAGKLATTALSTGRTVRYEYNTAGQFSKFTDEFGAATTMTYTAEGWLASVTDPAGIVTMANTYDAAGRVATQTSASGGITTFAYNSIDGSTLVTDSVTGTGVRYQHDAQGHVIAISDPYGNAVSRIYDTHSNLVGGIDRNGFQATATYDTHNNVTSTVEPGVGTTTYVYDTSDRLISTTDPWGAVTTYGYELVERIPSTVTNALNQT
jgi:YD repeat-containing protein